MVKMDNTDNDMIKALLDGMQEGEPLRIGSRFEGHVTESVEYTVTNGNYRDVAIQIAHDLMDARRWARKMKRERDEWKGRYHKRFYDIETWMVKAEQLQSENAALRERLEKATDLIRSVEFVQDNYDDPTFCPWCHMLDTPEHHPDCPARPFLESKE